MGLFGSSSLIGMAMGKAPGRARFVPIDHPADARHRGSQARHPGQALEAVPGNHAGGSLRDGLGQHDGGAHQAP